MIDASIRFAILALAVEWGTRRVRRSAPAAAHALWLLVLLAAAVFPLLDAMVAPVAFVHPAGRIAAYFPTSASATQWGAIAWRLYAAGALIAFARMAVGLAMIRSLVRRSRALGVDALPPFVAHRLAHGRAVSFHETAALGVPVTVGFIRPRVLLPLDWRVWPSERLHAVVRHELAHIERADYLTGLAAAAVQSVFWFHPAAWLAGRRASLCAELACDRAASSGDDDYATHLLALAARRPSRLRYGWSVGAATSLTERIDALVSAGASRRGRPAVVIAGCLLLFSCLVAAAPFRIVPARRDATPSTLSPHLREAHQLHAHAH